MILDETSGREQENVRRRRYIEKVDEANETREREREISRSKYRRCI